MRQSCVFKFLEVFKWIVAVRTFQSVSWRWFWHFRGFAHRATAWWEAGFVFFGWGSGGAEKRIPLRRRGRRRSLRWRFGSCRWERVLEGRGFGWSGWIWGRACCGIWSRVVRKASCSKTWDAQRLREGFTQLFAVRVVQFIVLAIF